MTANLLRNVRALMGGCDLTGQANKVELAVEVDEKDVTTYGSYDAASDSIWQEVIGGLAKAKIEGAGFWQAGDPSMVDDAMWSALGGLGAVTVCPHTAAAGSLAYVGKALTGQYKLGDKVGEVVPWSASLSSSWPIARGVVLHPPGTARTATGSGSAVLYQAAGAGQHITATLHVLSVAGTGTPTITVKVQSDVDNTFATPADVITFSGATAVGGQVLRALGPNTDTYWRVTWTITGSSPSFAFVAAVGVGA